MASRILRRLLDRCDRRERILVAPPLAPHADCPNGTGMAVVHNREGAGEAPNLARSAAGPAEQSRLCPPSGELRKGDLLRVTCSG